MQVNVKYEYTELYLPTPRCRKYRSRDAKKSCEAKVKEVKASELVPAFTVDEYVCPIYEKRHIYAFEGALWELDRYSEHHARKSWYDLTPCNEDYIAYLLTPANWEIYKFRTETEKIEEVIHNKSKNYLICNGKLYRKTTEPMYGIFTFGLGHNHASTVLFIEMGYNANVPSSRYFAANQREEAIAKAKEIALNRGDTNSIKRIEEAPMIVVHDNKFVKENPQSWNLAGDDFSNLLENITENAGSSTEAGILAMCAAFMNK